MSCSTKFNLRGSSNPGNMWVHEAFVTPFFKEFRSIRGVMSSDVQPASTRLCPCSMGMADGSGPGTLVDTQGEFKPLICV